jgi:hypothetical protein
LQIPLGNFQRSDIVVLRMERIPPFIAPFVVPNLALYFFINIFVAIEFWRDLQQ